MAPGPSNPMPADDRAEPRPNLPPGNAFEALRGLSQVRWAGRAIGAGIAAARDAVARLLIRVGVTPNALTLVGFAITCGAAYCLARGAGQQVPYFHYVRAGPVGWWPIWTLALLFLAAACDMLDGAVARLGNLKTRSGAVLDSTVDRFSDMALYIGCLLYFALHDPPNITYQLLAVLSLCSAVLISYIKARADNLIEDCSVGFWLRGERFAGLMIACSCGHVSTYLWQMSISCLFTVWRRISYAYRVLNAEDRGRPLPPRGPSPGWFGTFQWWRYPRGSTAHDVVTGAHILFIIFAPCIWPSLLAVGAWGDPLRRWFGW